MACATRLSSKGQVVIPAAVREHLGLNTGTELTIEMGPPGERRLVLRAAPSLRELERRLENGYRWLEQSGEDLVRVLHDARARARKTERTHRRA
jgi:AbrB family looped-hinge helix DNA binding protein